MRVYAFQSMGLPQIIAQDDRGFPEGTGFKASLSIPRESAVQVAKVLLNYASRVDPVSVMKMAQEIVDTKDDVEKVAPFYLLPMFTDQDRNALISHLMDELCDENLKDRATRHAEGLTLVETIARVFPNDAEALAEMLQRIQNGDGELHIDGEFLREHDDGDGYDTMLNYAVRVGLLNKEETLLTDTGKAFVAEFA